MTLRPLQALILLTSAYLIACGGDSGMTAETSQGSSSNDETSSSTTSADSTTNTTAVDTSTQSTVTDASSSAEQTDDGSSSGLGTTGDDSASGSSEGSEDASLSSSGSSPSSSGETQGELDTRASEIFADPDNYIALKSQLKFQVEGGAYEFADDAIKSPWSEWVDDPNAIPNRTDLLLAIDDAYAWLHADDRFEDFRGQPSTALTATGDGAEAEDSDTVGPRYYIALSDAWERYVWWVAHNIALDVAGELAWSLEDIAANDATHLGALFDSTELMHRRYPQDGVSDVGLGGLGHRNYEGTSWGSYVGSTIFGTPRYTYRFLVQEEILQPTVQATIHRLFDWASANMVHFYGSSNRINAQAHWGHRYFPTVEMIIEGTIREGETEPRHWTMGCHGTSQFFEDVLRAVNIPARVLYTCQHAQLWVPTEGLFLDHGDDPYNNNYTNSSCSAEHLLLDHETFSERFGPPENHADAAFCETTPDPVGLQVSDETLATCE